MKGWYLMKLNFHYGMAIIRTIVCFLLSFCYYTGSAAPVDDLIDHLKSLPAEQMADSTLVVIDMQYDNEDDIDESRKILFDKSRDLQPGELRFYDDYDVTIENVNGRLYLVNGSPQVHDNIKKLVLFAKENDLSIINVNYFSDNSPEDLDYTNQLKQKQIELKLLKNNQKISELEYENKFLEFASSLFKERPGTLLGTSNKIIPEDVKVHDNYKYSIKYGENAFSDTDSDLLEISDTSRYVMTGCYSEKCVLKSVQDGLRRGKTIFVSSDTVAPTLGKGRTNWNTKFAEKITERKLQIFGDPEAFAGQAAAGCD